MKKTTASKRLKLNVKSFALQHGMIRKEASALEKIRAESRVKTVSTEVATICVH